MNTTSTPSREAASATAVKRPALTTLRQTVAGDVLDRAPPFVERDAALPVDVETDDAEPDFRMGEGERQADVAEPDDTDDELPALDPIVEVSHAWRPTSRGCGPTPRADRREVPTRGSCERA